MRFIKDKCCRILVVLLLIAMVISGGTAGAADTPITTIQGKVFHDQDLDGVLDGNESFSSLTGMSALLTSLSEDMPAVNINIQPDGTFRLLDNTGTAYSLGVGTYKLTIINDNADTSLTPAFGFTTTTSSTHSSFVGRPPFGSIRWYMDIPQGVPADDNSPGIAADQASAVYVFEVTETSGATHYVGVALASPATVTFTTGTGIAPHFGEVQDPDAKVLRNTVIGSIVPQVEGDDVLPDYDMDTVMWTLDKTVALWDGTAIPAGTKITNEQFKTVKVAEDLLATASLALLEYDIIYDYAQGTAPATANPASYNVEGIFPIAISNEPARGGYTFAGWTVDYANEALTDVTTAVKPYSIPSGTTGNITLMATWIPNAYTITYHNGHEDATGTMDDQAATYDANLMLTRNAFEREGYSFIGWNTKADGTGTAYGNEHSFAPWQGTEDLALYAQWKPIILTVEFVDYNGAVLKTEEVPYGENATAPANPARDGYMFTGWDIAFTNVMTNLTVTAQYEKLPDPEPTTTTTTSGSNTPPTGDNSNITLWMILACVSLFVLVVFVLVVKRKRKYDTRD